MNINIAEHPLFDPNDISVAINDLILTAQPNQHLYLESGEYKSRRINCTERKTLSIDIKGSVELIVDNSLLRVRNDLPMNFNMARATTSVPNATALEIEESYHGNYTLGVIGGFVDGIACVPNRATTTKNEGVQYCRFTFDRIEVSGKCISFRAGLSNLPWVNENAFYGGRVMGGYGIHMERSANQIDPFNGNKFYGVGFEEVTKPIRIEFALSNMFLYFRMSESINSSTWIESIDSTNNVFRTQSHIPIDYIKDDVDGTNEYEFILLYENGGEYVAGSMRTAQGRKFLYSIPRRAAEKSASFYNGNFVTDSKRNYDWFATGADDGASASLVLDNRFGYPGGNLNSFHVDIAYLGGTIEIRDNLGNIIANNSNLTEGVFLFKWLSASKGWRITKIGATVDAVTPAPPSEPTPEPQPQPMPSLPSSYSVPVKSETQQFSSGSGDIADSPIIWYNEADPSKSIVIGTNKSGNGGLAVYNLDGTQRQFLSIGECNNVDVRDGVFGDRALVVTTNRTINALTFAWLDKTTRMLTLAGNVSVGFEPYGGCLYVGSGGEVYAFVTQNQYSNGQLDQYRVSVSGNDVSATKVRDMTTPSLSEGIVAQDGTGYLFLAEEDAGIYRYNAEPNGGTSRTQIDTVYSGGPVQDVEGMTIARYGDSDTEGYIIVSSQGDSTYHLYDLSPPHARRKSFELVSGNGADSTQQTDGISAMWKPMGALYPNGLFVAHDATNSGGSTSNFKLVDLGLILGNAK